MADAVVNFLAENLLQLLTDNVKLIGGAKGELENLLKEVQHLKGFLDDAAKLPSDSEQWKVLVEEIHKTVHRAEDTIDKFVVQAKLHQEKNKVGRFFDVSHLAILRNLAAEVKDIREQLKELRQCNRQAFQPTKSILMHWEDELVGFDEEANGVIKRLVDGPTECLDIVPVVGMPGLGKTTLARKIYNDYQLSYEFFSMVWVYVGQKYKIKDMFLNILKFFTKSIEEYLNETAEALAKVISGFIKKGGRCLICLDDVWETKVIDGVKKVFPQNGKGHRVMMTTRHYRLASYANPNPHSLKFLTQDESFELLVKIAFGGGSCPNNELVRVGKSIARTCGGVPLAVVIIAGVLRGRPDKSDWKIVEKYVAQQIFMDRPESCLKFVEISYDHLPQEIQTCFLYCGVFPRGFDIPSWKVIRLWIAEGLIKHQETYTLEEIAQFYLNDLINRNLLILQQRRSDGQIKTCRLHDMLHHFCRIEASNKWLFQEICLTSDQVIPSIQDQDTYRRLCIQPSILNDFLSKRPFAEHVRSFYCFSSIQSKKIELSPNILVIPKAFPLIRVMDIESLEFSLSRNFNHLIQLRYIAISGDFKVLPEPFGKLWNLQTLILNTSTLEPTLEVKANIWNMLQLRHLHTNIPAVLPPPPPLGKASCLQTLSVVTPESCKKDVLAKACHLRKLSIRGQMAAFLETKGGINNLEELKCLEHLKLLNLYKNEVLSLPPSFFRLVHTVRELTLANTRFAWREADRLGLLEFLKVLKLKENAFTGQSWKPEIGGFSHLQVLWIERAADLEFWEASNLNFPRLRHLVLISCDKLNGVPLGLADIPNLQEMRLENTVKAVKSAKDILESKNFKSIKFKLTVFPPEITDSKATQ